MPSPLAAVMLLSLVLLTSNVVVLAVGMAVIGLLMVSRLAYPLQRGPIVSLAVLGWVLGIAGTLGLYDVRIFAAFVLLMGGVVLPCLPRLRPRFRAAV